MYDSSRAGSSIRILNLRVTVFIRALLSLYPTLTTKPPVVRLTAATASDCSASSVMVLPFFWKVPADNSGPSHPRVRFKVLESERVNEYAPGQHPTGSSICAPTKAPWTSTPGANLMEPSSARSRTPVKKPLSMKFVPEPWSNDRQAWDGATPVSVLFVCLPFLHEL